MRLLPASTFPLLFFLLTLGLEHIHAVVSSSAAKDHVWEPMEPFRSKNELALLADKYGFTKAIEVGVRTGAFALSNLKNWPLCEEYHLVDVWKQQENYEDSINVPDKQQERNYNKTMHNMRNFRSKVHVCRNYSHICAKKYQKEYFDWVYLDARHDRKGVLADLEDYWPLLKHGGIMSGHDFINQREVNRYSTVKQDWTKNFDGTVDETRQVTRGAVLDFFNDKNSDHLRQVTVSYSDKNKFVSWAVRK